LQSKQHAYYIVLDQMSQVNPFVWWD